MKTIGEKLSPILKEIEDTLWEFETQELGNPKFTQEGFRASIKIFAAALMDKMWELQAKENMPQRDREKMAEYAGKQIKVLVYEMTGIKSNKLYESPYEKD